MAELGASPTADRRTVAIDLRYDWPAALIEAGFDRTQPTAWIAEGLLGYLPPEAQDRLLDNISALSADGSRLATEAIPNLPDVDQDKARELMREATEKWRAHGFDLNFDELGYQGERNDVAEYLTGLGWRSVGQPMSRAAGRARPSAGAADQRLGVDGRHDLLHLDQVMQAPQRRGFNEAVTRFWSVAAPAYNLPFLQQWVYRPAHDEVVAQLRDHQSRAGGRYRLRHRDSGRPDSARPASGCGLWRGHVGGHAQTSPVPIERSPVAARACRAVAFRRRSGRRGRDDLGVPLLRPAGGTARIPPGVGPRWTGRRIDTQRTAAASAGRAAGGHRHTTRRPAEMRKLFEGAGFSISEQHRVRRPLWTRAISDLITVGIKS